MKKFDFDVLKEKVDELNLHVYSSSIVEKLE